MKFSASMLSTWMSCPLKAKFSYVEGLPQKQNAAASFGTCVHEALEQYNKSGNMEQAIARFLETWENPELLDVVPEVWPKRTSYGGFREIGVQILNEYQESTAWSKREMIASEHKFCVPLGDHLLSGIVDLIEYVPNKLKVVDYKGGSYRPNMNSLYLNVQMTTYWYASLQPEFWMGYDDGTGKYQPMENGEELYERFKKTKRSVIWHHLRANKEYNCGVRDDLDFMRLYRCCQEISKAIEHDVYVPNISGDSCMLCDHTSICAAFIPPHQEVGMLTNNQEGSR